MSEAASPGSRPVEHVENPGPRARRDLLPPGDLRATSFDRVDDASDDSFPASDAPSWTGMHVGAPRSNL